MTWKEFEEKFLSKKLQVALVIDFVNEPIIIDNQGKYYFPEDILDEEDVDRFYELVNDCNANNSYIREIILSARNSHQN